MTGTLSVTHPFVSAKSDGADASKVRPTNWNAAHSATYDRAVTGSAARNLVAWLDDTVINVKDFGAVGNGTTDDTAAIQAAIDYGVTANRKKIFMPRGQYKITSSIYLDHPSNLRVSLSTSAVGAFSLELCGEGSGTTETWATLIKPATADFTAIWVGPGQNNMVRDLGISFASPTFADGQAAFSSINTSCQGVGIAAGGSGNSGSMVENVRVVNAYTCFGVGTNGADALADSTTFLKCQATGYYGFRVKNTQGYITSVIDATVNATISVKAGFNVTVYVTGGNFSTGQGKANRFTVGSTSALSTTSVNYGGTFNTWSFTTILASPDTHVGLGTYTGAVMNLTGFGCVPLDITAYDSGTSTMTLRIDPHWMSSIWGTSTDITSTTDISAEIAACTDLYVFRRIVVFKGGSESQQEFNGGGAFRVKNVHFESVASVVTLIDHATGCSTFDDCQFQYDIMNYNYRALTSGQEAVYYGMQAFPFVRAYGGSNVEFRGIDFGTNGGVSGSDDGFICDVAGNGISNLRFSNCNGFSNPTMRYAGTSSTTTMDSRWHGCGEFTDNPFFPNYSGNLPAVCNDVPENTHRRYPMRGTRPDPNKARPQLSDSHIVTLTGTLPTLATGYPLLHGDTFYGIQPRIASSTNTYPTFLYAKSTNLGFSYGQNLTQGAGNGQISSLSISWKGQSPIVRLDSVASTKYMFPGLVIGLDDGGGVKYYYVIGVHHYLQYVEVRSFPSTFVISGTKTTTYTDTTIYQESYNLQLLGHTSSITLSADYTLTDSATAQKCFDSSSNGAVTARAATTYEFDAEYILTNTGTTSHTWAVLFAGTATFTSIQYSALAWTQTGNALTAVSGIYATAATATVVTAASTSATENVVIKLKGIMRVNGAGTIIPQIKASAQPNGTETMLKNSFFRMKPTGSNTVTTIGNWS